MCGNGRPSGDIPIQEWIEGKYSGDACIEGPPVSRTRLAVGLDGDAVQHPVVRLDVE